MPLLLRFILVIVIVSPCVAAPPTGLRPSANAAATKPATLAEDDPQFPGLSGEAVRRRMTGPQIERRVQPPLPLTAGVRQARAATVERQQVTVGLAEDDGITRHATPVRFGFPLPKGALFDPAQVRLLAANGQEVPAQFTISGLWGDDSIRWLTVTFLADLQAKAGVQYIVEFGSAVHRQSPPMPVHRQHDGDRMVIETGAMTAVLNTKHFGLFDEIRVGGSAVVRSAEGGLLLTTLQGQRFTSAAGEASVRVEEDGPLTTSLRIEGPLADETGRAFFRHVTRLRFYAGSTKVDVACTLLDDSLDHELAVFRSVELPLRLTEGAQRARFALEAGETTEALDVSPARLLQRDDTSGTLSGANPASGRRAPGRVAVSSAAGNGIGVAVEDFWQNYPLGLRADGESLTVELWPDVRDQTVYAKLPGYLRFPFVGGGYRFKWGMSRTRRMRFDFATDARDPEPAEPLVMVVPAAWYEHTGALGPMVARSGSQYAMWDQAFERCFADRLRNQESKREYGFFNYGDWFGESGYNWGNNEYDLPHALFMQFARTGDRRYYRVAMAGARHQADVDCVHAYPDPTYVGADVEHSVDHTGARVFDTALALADKAGWSHAYDYGVLASNGHTWAGGMCDAWYLAADERVMEAAQGLGEHIVYGMVPRFKTLGTHERSAGWSLIAIMNLYRATRDPLYLDAANKIAEIALRERKPGNGSGWAHELPGDHCLHSRIPGAKRCEGNACFLIGILGSGLKDYYLETGDARAREAILGTAAFWKQMWVPDVGGFPYTSCPLMRPQAGPLTGMLCADTIAFIAEQTHDADLMDIAVQTVTANIFQPAGGDGKAMAQWSTFSALTLATLQGAGSWNEGARKLATLSEDDWFRSELAKAKPTTFIGVRAPKEKQFVVDVTAAGETIAIARKTHGSMPKRDASGTVVLAGPDGREVRRETFDTDKPLDLNWPLPADAPQGVYRVRIVDDLRGIWQVQSTGGKVGLDCSGQPSLANYRFNRLYFRVPAGVKKFRLGITPDHDGSFGLAVFDGAGQLRQLTHGVKSGKAESRSLDIEVPAGSDNAVWSFVAEAGMDWKLSMVGIPAYVSTSATGWFGE